MVETTTRVPGRPPGERQRDESPQAYAAFRRYLEAGLVRSVVAVAAECNKSTSLLHRWSSRHRWKARAEAWDSHLRSQYDAELVEVRRASARRHLRVAAAALGKVETRLVSLDAATLSPADVVRLWDVAARIERDALGEPTRLEVTGRDGGPVLTADVAHLDDEQRRERMLALRRELDARLTEEEQ